MTGAGRPIRAIVGVSPILTELATDMVVTRKDRGVTLAKISEISHYSISTLSQATSGQCIPTPGVIKAYAKALGVDPARWNELRLRAVREKHGEAAQEKDAGGNEPPPRPAPAAAPSAAVRTVVPRGRGPVSQIAAGMKLPSGRDPGHGDVAEQERDAAAASRVQQLVMEAVEQATGQLHGNPTANVLSLCTVPADLLELLRETRSRREISLKECAAQLRGRGIVMSSTSLARLLQGQELPEAELLHAMLVACKVPPAEIQIWLYHRARLELARERQIQRKKGQSGTMVPSAPAYRSAVSYRVIPSNMWGRMYTWSAVAMGALAALPWLYHWI